MIPLVSATCEHWAFAALLLSLMLKFLFWPPCNIKSVCPICHQSGPLICRGLHFYFSLLTHGLWKPWAEGAYQLSLQGKKNFFSLNQSLKFSLSLNYIALIPCSTCNWWTKGPPTIKARDSLGPKALCLWCPTYDIFHFFFWRTEFHGKTPIS